MKGCFLVHAQKALQDMQLRANNAFETDEMRAVALRDPPAAAQLGRWAAGIGTR